MSDQRAHPPSEVGDLGEASEFDLVSSIGDEEDNDSETYVKHDPSALPEEADEADAVEQTQEVPADDDEPHA